MAADPRFASWVAADDDTERQRRAEERRELIRIAAQQVIDEAKLGPVDPHRLAWAQQTVANIKPLGRPLGTGEPHQATAIPHPSTADRSA